MWNMGFSASMPLINASLWKSIKISDTQILANEKMPFSFNSISFLYCWRSVSDKRPLSARNEKQAASLPMIIILIKRD